MTPSLRDVVSDWLKINRPFMEIELNKVITSRSDGAHYYYGDIEDTYVEFLDPNGKWTDPGKDFDFKNATWSNEPLIRVYAADPEFFEKLAKFLPPKL